MKYEDFWGIYFTILRILLIFYLTHSCIYLLNYHHPFYLSEIDSLLPMFPLLILIYWYYCWGIWCDCRVCVLDYRVWCFHQLTWSLASVSILPDCFIGILVSSLLVVVHPVGSLQLLTTPVIGLLSVFAASWQPICIQSVEARRPFNVIAIYTVVVGDGFGSRQLSRQCVADPWWWILDGGFPDDMKFDEGWW